jgi:hypothetical protein
MKLEHFQITLGKSQNILIPDSDCNVDLCAAEGGLCSTLEQPGVHKLGELEGDVGVNGTIALPGISSALKVCVQIMPYKHMYLAIYQRPVEVGSQAPGRQRDRPPCKGPQQSGLVMA